MFLLPIVTRTSRGAAKGEWSPAGRLRWGNILHGERDLHLPQSCISCLTSKSYFLSRNGVSLTHASCCTGIKPTLCHRSHPARSAISAQRQIQGKASLRRRCRRGFSATGGSHHQLIIPMQWRPTATPLKWKFVCSRHQADTSAVGGRGGGLAALETRDSISSSLKRN